MNHRPAVALFIIALGAMLLPVPVKAQRGFAGAPVSMSHGHGGRGFPAKPGPRPVLVGPQWNGRFFRHSRFGIFPFYYPYFDSDYYSGYYSEPPAENTAAPQVVVVQTAPTATAAPAIAPDPLLLEMQNNHWVRVTASGTEVVPQADPQSSGASSQAQARPVDEATAQSAPPPPTVLVFRDGHQEEVKKYTIVGANLYASSDYWNTGSWTRKVSIATLDVSATLKANQAHGVNFSLPSGPGEVIVQP